MTTEPREPFITRAEGIVPPVFDWHSARRSIRPSDPRTEAERAQRVRNLALALQRANEVW